MIAAGAVIAALTGLGCFFLTGGAVRIMSGTLSAEELYRNEGGAGAEAAGLRLHPDEPGLLSDDRTDPEERAAEPEGNTVSAPEEEWLTSDAPDDMTDPDEPAEEPESSAAAAPEEEWRLSDNPLIPSGPDASAAGTAPTPEPTAVPTLAQTSVPTETPVPAKARTTGEVKEIKGSGGKKMIRIAKVSATSWVARSEPKAYLPEKMTDGIDTTSWQFCTDDSKLGETYAYFDFTMPADVDELWIKNGFWKTTGKKDQYTRNGRVRQMGIAFRYEGSDEYTDKKTIRLKDDKKRKDWQKISLGRHTGVTGIRIRILSIYKGTYFKKDVAISEILFVQDS